MGKSSLDTDYLAKGTYSALDVRMLMARKDAQIAELQARIGAMKIDLSSGQPSLHEDQRALAFARAFARSGIPDVCGR